MIHLEKEVCPVCKGSKETSHSRDGMCSYTEKCGSCQGKGFKVAVYDDETKLGILQVKDY